MPTIERPKADELSLKIPAPIRNQESIPNMLRSSEIRYRRLFEAARDGILILDAVTLKITDVNPFMTWLLGYKRDEFLGKELWQLGFFSDIEASKEAFSELQDTGYLRYEDLPLKTINGELRDVEFVSNVYDEDSAPVIQCNIRDITVRKQDEERKLLLERRYHTLFDHAPDGIVIACPKSYYLDANASMCRMLGYDHGELIGMHASDIVTAPEIKHLESEFAAVKTTSDYHREWQFRRKDGSEFPGEVIATVMPDGNLFAMIRDITERKRAEDDLRESESLLKASEAELRALFAAMNDVIVVFDYEGRHLKVAPTNPPYFYRRGIYRIGKTVHEIFPPDIADFLLTNIQTCLDESRTLNVEYTLSAEGKDFWFDGTVTPMTDDSVVWVARDITERKRAEDELRESESLLAASQRITHLGSWVMDLSESEDGKPHKEYWSDEHYRIYGLEPGQVEITDEVFYNSVHPEDRELLANTIRQSIEQKEPFTIEHRIILPDGRERIVRAMGELVVDDYSGKPLKLLGSVQDITERKLTEAALTESEERYRSVVETAPDVIVTIDDSSTICFVNPAGERIFGYGIDEMSGSSLTMLMPEYLRHLHEAGFKRFQKTGVKHVSWDYVELTGLHKSGREIPITVSFSEYVQNDRRYFTGIIRDISDRKRAMEALQESEERYRELVENALDMIYTHDLQGNYTSVNKAAERITGYTAKESLSMNIADTIPADQLEKAKKMIAAKLDGDEITAYELELLAKDGHSIMVEVNTRIIYADGVPVGVQGIARDITERKAGEAARLASERKYQSLFTLAPVGIYQSQPDGSVTTANAALAHMLGYDSAEELVGNNFANIYFDPDERGELLNKYERRGFATDIDLQWKQKDGSPVWVQLTAHAIKDSDGETEYFEGFVRDITERKLAEKEIELAMQRLNAAQRLGRIGDWEWNVATESITWSPEVFEIVGRDPLLGPPKDYAEMSLSYDAPSRELLAANVSAAMESGEAQEYELVVVRPNGERVITQAVAEPRKCEDGQIFALAGTIQDITERKRADAALQEKTALLEAQVNSTIDGILVVDENGNQIIQNQQLVDLFKIPQHIADDPDDSRQVKWVTGMMKEPEKFVEKVVHLYSHPDEVSRDEIELKSGTILDRYSAPVIGKDDKNYGRIWTFRDITERKRADESIRESEERFSGAFEYAPIGVALVSPDGHWLKVNRALCDLVGYSEAELLKSTFQDITHKDDLEYDLDHMRRLVLGEIASYQIEKRYIHKLGHLVSIVLNVSLVRDAEGQPRYFIAQIQDITARKQLEEQLRQSQKMEAVGVLAGGIAHDFNNLLTAINGYSDLTLRKMLADDPLRHNIQEIKEAGDRAADLTGQLLAFSRKQVLKPRVYNLNDAISEIDKMLRRIMRESIELRTILAPDLGNIKADPGQIEQVIMNLAVNARDAMQKGGTLTIETKNVYLDDDYVSQHIAISPGLFVKLTVTDTGEGMDEETQRHIFDPFFTTKEVGRGTGLGLATVYGIVKQSGGDIMVYSEIGHGTTFKIYLPCVDQPVERPKWVDSLEKYTGTETILLVEDEEIVRNLVREVLKENGYTVLEAANGKAALSICKTYAEPIHMLLTDVIMPKMSGNELRDLVIKSHPDIKVLFMSGYTDDAMAYRGIFDSDSEFIEKPFTPDGLARKVREVLEY